MRLKFLFIFASAVLPLSLLLPLFLRLSSFAVCGFFSLTEHFPYLSESQLSFSQVSELTCYFSLLALFLFGKAWGGTLLCKVCAEYIRSGFWLNSHARLRDWRPWAQNLALTLASGESPIWGLYYYDLSFNKKEEYFQVLSLHIIDR